jgi:hypothetical protein
MIHGVVYVAGKLAIGIEFVCHERTKATKEVQLGDEELASGD